MTHERWPESKPPIALQNNYRKHVASSRIKTARHWENVVYVLGALGYKWSGGAPLGDFMPTEYPFFIHVDSENELTWSFTEIKFP